MPREEIVDLLGGEKNVARLEVLETPGMERFTGEASERPHRGRLGQVRKKRAKGPLYSSRMVIKTRAVKSLSERLGYPRDDLMWILNVRGRTAQRREQEGTLSEDESDRLYRVARVTQKAELAFDSRQRAHDWLKQRNPALRGAVPLSLLATDAGAEAVTDELTRIEYGDLF